MSLIAAPPAGIYLGAQVNPSATPGGDDQFSDTSNQETETEYLEQNVMGRSLALHHEYRDWTALESASTDPEFKGDVEFHRVPVISMNCGDDINGKNYNLVDIANGKADSDLGDIRTALLKLTYLPPHANDIYPVMLRYFWEFNDNIGGGSGNHNGGCFVTPGTQQPPGSSPYTIAPDYPTQFKAAWIQVRAKLLGSIIPVPNITFVWNPDMWDDGLGGNDPTNYYPGSAYVDWIGIDGYGKVENSAPLTFDQVFGSFMAWANNNVSTLGQKPIMIGETASCAEYAPPSDQASYLQGAQHVLDDATDYPAYSNVHAFLYFDAPGGYTYGNPQVKCHWSLDANPQPPATGGLSQFTTMGMDSNFAPIALPSP